MDKLPALISQLFQMTWQPIDTLPEDKFFEGAVERFVWNHPKDPLKRTLVAFTPAERDDALFVVVRDRNEKPTQLWRLFWNQLP